MARTIATSKKKSGREVTTVSKAKKEQIERDIAAAEKRRLKKKAIGKAKRAAK
jgi:hypothetical protein